MHKQAPHSVAAATAWPHVAAAKASTRRTQPQRYVQASSALCSRSYSVAARNRSYGVHNTHRHTYIQTRMHANIQTLPAEAAAKHTNTCNIHIHIQHTHTHTHSPVAAVSAVSGLASYVQRAWTPRLRHCSCLARRWQRRSVDYGHVSVASLQRYAHVGCQLGDAV